jgi:membrane fusion protein, multidrug efflux system
MVDLLETSSRDANPPAGVGHQARPWKPKRSGPAVLVTAVVVAALATGLFAPRGRRQAVAAQHEAAPVAVAATVVQPTEVPAALETVGSLRAVREVVLAPELAGRIVTLHFESGARVKAGDRLVQLYDAPERADRAAAEARASLARSELARSVNLASTGVEPKQLLERRQADVDQAVASMQQLTT